MIQTPAIPYPISPNYFRDTHYSRADSWFCNWRETTE